MKSFLHTLARRITGLLDWRPKGNAPTPAASASNTFPAWIEAQQWDGRPRLSSWLSTVLQREPSAYLDRAGTYILMAHVARALTPGCRFDYVPLLYGPPGTGKSSLIHTLVGEAQFNDEPFDASEDAYQPQLHGYYAYELAEIDAFRRSEQDLIKAFLTARTDFSRPAYSHLVQEHPRTCIVWATSHRPMPGRRFWPLHAPHKIDLEWLHRERAQLFAEARHRLVVLGESYEPTSGEERQVFGPEIVLNAGHGEDVLGMHLREVVQPGEFVTLADVMQRLRLPSHISHEARVRGALMRNNFVVWREASGDRRRGFIAPARFPGEQEGGAA